MTDVTDKVLIRKRIEEAEEKLRLAIESADLGTYELDLASNEIQTSQRFNEIWGIKHHMDRLRLASFIHPEDRPIRQKAHEESLRSGTLHYEVRLNKQNNTLAWIRVKGRFLYDKEGKPVTLIGVVQDITEQKMFAVELERQVLERTEELQAANEEIAATNEELSEANNNLMKANFDLEQFNYAASHDLQEPVRKIQTFSELLLSNQEVALNERNDSYLKKIGLAAKRMKTIIDDLLLYSHHSRNEKQSVQTDLNEIVSTVQSDLDLLIDQKNAVIHCDPLPTIEAVPVQMHQLFLNLISNSLKFSKAGDTPVINIRHLPVTQEFRSEKQLPEAKTYHHICVEDNGIGFPQDYAEYVFQLFKRLHPRTEYSGTGIGLSLCKKIVENHRGIIFAESQPGRGTKMHVVLPQRP